MNSQNSDDIDALSRDSVAMMISKCLHDYGGSQREWICNVIDYSLKLEFNIRRQRRILRIPTTLAEPGFILTKVRCISPGFKKRIAENYLDAILVAKELLQES